MTHESLEHALMEKYQEIFQRKGNTPDWAYRKLYSEHLIHPSIPFVGKHYWKQPIKILMYASAENLSDYDGRIDDDSIAINRHRIFFDKSPKSNGQFPNVHIEPVNNGSLVMCAYYIMSKLTAVGDVSPAEFLEMIPVANYGKYTWYRDGKSNSDYASNSEMLKESQDYIKADISVLQPDYIIMVESMYTGGGKQKDFIDDIKGKAKVIPIYQITATTINNPHTFREFSDFSPASINELDDVLKRWYDNNQAGIITNHNFLSVFGYLDNKLKMIL